MGEIHILALFRESFTLVIMLFCSILSITFALERWWYFRTAQASPDDVLSHVRKSLEGGKTDAAAAYCQKHPSAVAQVVHYGLLHAARSRKDLEELIRHGKTAGLRMGTIPAATPNLTRERLASLKEAGVDQLAFSIDGATAASHDTFRRTPGAFDTVLRACRQARELDIPIQINSCFGAWNWHEFDAVAKLVTTLDIAFWEVFFLIPVGRGAKLGGLTPAQFEEGFAKLRKMTQEQPFVVKLTEGQHFRRYALQQEVHAGEGVAARVEHTVARPASLRAGLRLPKRAVNAADGFMFVDHVGDICPSGFLPVRRGNVRRDELATVYRQDEMFRDLRDHSKLKGRCGVCEYREVCGGSRARSWAITGDIFAEDPSCGYQPKGGKS